MSVITPKWNDVKKMSNKKLADERNKLYLEIVKTENDRMDKESDFYNCWIEDESIIYAWKIERLEVILAEIKRRMSKAKWIFEEEHNFF